MKLMRNKVLFCCLTASLLWLAAAQSARSENWPQWRGPELNGSTSEKNLPVQWSKTENVAWVTPLPGPSGSTPAIWGDSIFISTPDAQKSLLLLSIDRKTGQERWRKQVAVGDRTIGRNNMSAPSPATDGKAVYVLYGTGDLAAFDFKGNELWTRNLAKDYGKFSLMWLYGSSPLLYDGKLYVQVLQRNPPADYAHAVDDKPKRESYILCIDPKTGKDVWRHVRPTDALAESMEAYSTPIPFEGKNGRELIIVGGDYLTGHDLKTGNELWRAAGLNDKKDQWWRIVPSPVVADGLIFVSGPKRDPLLAVRGGGRGDVTRSHLAWKFTEFPTDCVTPAYHNGKLFVLDGDKQMMTCLDPKTGEEKWQGNLGVREIFRSSPSVADGKIYCISEKGTVVVLGAGDEFKVLSTIKMGEDPVYSSIAIANGQLFIRTAKNLYCIGKK